MENKSLQMVEPAEVNRRIALGDTFVVNIVAQWCPDCTERQANYIDVFADALKSQGLDTLQVVVQRQRGEFLSAAHEALTTLFGGHGYPRTVLIKEGLVADQDNVEVITDEGLLALATKFTEIVSN